MFFKIRNHTVFPSVMVSWIAATGAALVAQRSLGLDPLFALRVMLLFGFGGAGLMALASKHLSPQAFKAANQVTLVRAALVTLLFAMTVEAATTATAWFAVLVAMVALILDGVDGWLARRDGESSNFGARFDMETDAFLILVVAILAWQHGRAGAWILAAGLMRYAFVAFGYVLPWMQRTLPDSYRRRVTCVVQVSTLIVSLLPVLPVRVSETVALSGLTILSASFAIDVVWLLRQNRRQPVLS